MNEIWLPILGSDGDGYEVSDLANVRSLDRIVIRSNGRSQFWRGQALKPIFVPDPQGRVYRKVRLANRKWHGVAALMLEAFVGPRPYPEAQARHLNDVSLDDRLDNLEWGSQSENWDDAKRNGRVPNLTGGSEPGEASYCAKLTDADVLAIRSGHDRGDTNASLARLYELDPSTVSRIVNRKLWRHLG